MNESKTMSNLNLTTEIVANYVGNHKLNSQELGALIKSVHDTLTNIDAPAEVEVQVLDKPTAGQIRKSIKHEGLVSFEDGKTYQTLKRHLTGRGLTIDDYKKKWGLPSDYPSTAPGYSAKRSEMAKSLGLGKGRAQPAPEAPAKLKRKAKATAKA